MLEALEAAGCEAWCVGGCVRDLRLGRTPGDWDVTTNALPEQTLALFGERAIPTGLQHGTVTVRTPERAVEITTFRRDGDYRDYRRPEQVTFTTSLEKDLSRRDFTVNAMAMDLRGTFRDPFGGTADLEAGILRCVGEPDRRFREDALRMMRGLRFAADLAFSIEPRTAEGIHRCAALLAQIAPERIQVELTKLLTGRGAAGVCRSGVHRLAGAGAYEGLCPGNSFPLLRCVGAHPSCPCGITGGHNGALYHAAARHREAGLYAAG